MRYATLGFVIVFYLVLLAAKLTGAQSFSEFSENRSLHKFPERWSQFRDLEAYISDQVPFRNAAILAVNSLRFYLFGAATGDQNVAGKKGWWFRSYPLTPQFQEKAILPEFVESLSQQLELQIAKYKAQGIPFVFLIVPSKYNIYPDFLPDSIRRSLKASESERVTRNLAAIFPDVVPNLFDILREARTDSTTVDKIYYRDDIHWTHEGAGILVRKLFNIRRPLEVRKEQIVGDQARQMGVYRRETAFYRMPIEAPEFYDRIELTKEYEGKITPRDRVFRYGVANGSRRLFLSGTSYVWNMIPTLLLAFDEILVLYHTAQGNDCDTKDRNMEQIIREFKPTSIMVLTGEVDLPRGEFSCGSFSPELYLP